MKSVLSIAGSDSSGGAGIQADIKTIAAYGLFAQTAITAVTAQNTMGVDGVAAVPPEFVAQQIDSVFADIVPDAVKIGMVGSADTVKAIAESLMRVHARNIVVDPVMVATSGASLAEDDAVAALRDVLIPMATLVTPNIPEAEVLVGGHIHDAADMEDAAEAIAAQNPGVAVLVKGGHAVEDADDVLALPNGELLWLKGERIDTPNTHGTGCTLSSAIACGLALGAPIPEAVAAAKSYLEGALRHDPKLGHGSGPMDHMWSYRR